MPATDAIQAAFGRLTEAGQAFINLFPDMQGAADAFSLGDMVVQDMKDIAWAIDKVAQALVIATGLTEQWREIVNLSGQASTGQVAGAVGTSLVTNLTPAAPDFEVQANRRAERMGVNTPFPDVAIPAPQVTVNVTLDGAQIASRIDVRQGAQSTAINDMGGFANQ